MQGWGADSQPLLQIRQVPSLISLSGSIKQHKDKEPLPGWGLLLIPEL